MPTADAFAEASSHATCSVGHLMDFNSLDSLSIPLAAPGDSSPSGTQYTLMDDEDSVSSREISRRQKKKAGRNDVSQVKEDSKLTL